MCIHTDRKVYAKNMCQVCYNRSWRQTVNNSNPKRRKPACHPDKRHAAKGLCSTCYSANAQRAWREQHPEQNLANWLSYKYSITLKQYKNLLTKQAGVCAVCRQPPEKKRLVVDHDHKTSKVRGLLCSRCNTMIGLSNENPLILIAAQKYLEENA